MLRLEVLDFEGPAAWRWRLTEETGGAFVADAEVRLDQSAWEFEAFGDLDGYLRWNAAPDRRAESEAELVAAAGAWIGAQVWGDVGPALADRAPVTVRVEVPPGAEVVAYRPLELGWIGGRPLGAQDVTLVIDLPRAQRRASAPVGERLRMLAVFSLPVDASALNLRRERVELARLIHRIAVTNGRAVELRVVQYGVTRERLEELMLEEEGWDVVHISGHGLPAGLLLERDDGHHDLISSDDLVRLLTPVVQQLKLVFLSSCESAALTAAEHLRLIGITPSAGPAGRAADGRVAEDEASENGNGARVLPALAAALAERMDCAVVAMRYPVADEFAIALARRLYDLVLGKGQPLARALGLTLPRVLAEPGTTTVPAISVATPALFGGRSAELRLRLPAGAPAVFDREQQKLAGFLPQPERFVGRVAAMSNATAALAPESDRSGVLFHGMAGAGKTACALELAYTHEQSFGRLVWHQAPLEGDDVAPALSAFALSLERQLPGLQLVHLVDDTAGLRSFLPGLRAFLARERVLIVLDNCESLLTAAGDWRDERWRMVVEALAEHGGLSRLVMTSRTRPRSLAPGMLVEPVHALSIHEAVLLAREWPHLRALMDATTPGLASADAHELAARTLAMVQGHPKLIELADGQAADPDILREQLDDADRAWLRAGITAEEFLAHGEPTAGADDYLRVLERWTRASAGSLPDASQLLFSVLCCIESDDRVEPVVRNNWADIWRRLQRPGESPSVESAAAPLSDHALVELERDPEGGVRAYHLHPAVAASGRADADPDLQAAVDHELAAYWTQNVTHALERESEQLGWLVLRAGRGALPYLARQHDWSQLNWIASQVLHRDPSLSTAANLLPLLRQAASAAEGSDRELSLRRTSARALESLRPAEAATEYRELLEHADTQQRYELAGVVAGDLIRVLRNFGRLDEALALCTTMQDYHRRAGLGIWTQLLDEGQRLQILALMGHSQQVLDEVSVLREKLAELPDVSEQPETTSPFNVREGILDTGRAAATSLRRWDDALALNAEQLESKRGRDASTLELASSAFNDYGPLLRLGRIDEARALLLACRQVFEQDHAISMLGTTLSALADVEDEVGHYDQALRFARDALRLGYTAGASTGLGGRHFNMSIYLGRSGGDPREVLAHLLAGAVIDYQTNSGQLRASLEALAFQADDAGSPPALEWEEVCERVGRIEGVRLGELVAQLPARASDGPAALAEVLRLAADLPREQVLDVERHVAHWEPVISAVLAASAGDPHAAELLERALTERGQHPDWVALSDVLRRVASGEHDPALLTGLDEIDTAIAQRALEAISGQTAIDADAWHALAAAPNREEPALDDHLATLADAVVAAARGDQDMTTAVQPLVADLAEHEPWANLSGVLQRILAGDRSPSLVDGLDSIDTAVVKRILTALADETAL